MRFNDRYRIPSARLPAWDYRGRGQYFVTFCTRDRVPWLGTVRRGACACSPIGEIVVEEWHRTALLRPYVRLDALVVMPDHVHALLSLLPTQAESESRVPSRHYARSLGAVIGHWKAQVTRRAWKAGYEDFAWQPRFYDSIIRSPRHLRHVRRYLRDNPRRWHERYGDGTPWW